MMAQSLGAVQSEPTRPLLRYHGGKWRLAPWIIKHFPSHSIYVEPYGGAGSVLLRKARSEEFEVINDLDGDIVYLFRVLRDPGASAELERQVVLTPFSRVEFWDAYEPSEDPIERARRILVRSWMAHGSTWRKKNRTGFRAASLHRTGSRSNAPAEWATFPEVMSSVSERLRGVLIECRPAIEVIQQQDSPATLFYCDPPYVSSTRTAIRTPSKNDRAYAHEMDDENHRELSEALRCAAGKVLISGYRCPLYDELFVGWRRMDKGTFADGGVRRTESLWISPNCEGWLFDYGDWEGSNA